MNKPNVARYFKTVSRLVKKHSPEILTGLGIAGMITTTVLAVKATPKALQLIEEEKREQNNELLDNAHIEDKNAYNLVDSIKPIEVVKVAWKPYIPAALIGMASVACLIGANTVSVRRHAALYSAYKLSETALDEYKEKVVETIGEKKEKTIKDKVAKDKVDNNPVTNSEVIITGGGNSLFYEPISNQYFFSDIQTVRKVVNDLNYSMGFGSEMYVSLNQFYDAFNLKHTVFSDQAGWNIDDGQITPDFSAQITDDGRPCIVIDWYIQPKYDYQKIY